MLRVMVISDDSVITITVTDNAGSDCGGAPVAQTITLTKK